MITPVQEPLADFSFTAVWIEPEPAAPAERSYFDARKEFFLESVPAVALLRITADYTYDLSINGIFCGHGPIRGSARLHYFDTLDVAEALRPGRNQIQVRVHSPEKPNFITAPVTPAVLIELPGIVKTDTSWETRLLPEWKSNVPIFTLQTGVMEYRDFRVSPGEWKPALEMTNQELLQKPLFPRDIPALEIRTVHPVNISARALLPPGDAPSLQALSAYLNEEKWSCLPQDRFDGTVLQPVDDDSAIALVWDFSGERWRLSFGTRKRAIWQNPSFNLKRLNFPNARRKTFASLRNFPMPLRCWRGWDRIRCKEVASRR